MCLNQLMLTIVMIVEFVFENMIIIAHGLENV